MPVTATVKILARAAGLPEVRPGVICRPVQPDPDTPYELRNGGWIRYLQEAGV